MKYDKKVPPKYIYKYYSNLDFALDVLCNDRVYLNIPTQFNDIFDSGLIINDQFFKDQLYTEEWGMLLKKRVSDKTKKVLAEIKNQTITLLDLFKILKNNNVSNEEIVKIRSFFDRINGSRGDAEYSVITIKGLELKRSYGITCFSAISDSILMWAHYGNHLNGVCLCFDTEENKLSNVKAINYSKDRVYSSREDRFFLKSADWQYEQEWRYLTYGNEEYITNVKCVKIIFGINVGIRTINGKKSKGKVLYDLAKEKGIEIFFAYPDKEKFKINIEKKKIMNIRSFNKIEPIF